MGNPTVSYRITEKGIELLNRISAILELLEAKELDEI
jgi:hypothetical protein